MSEWRRPDDTDSDRPLCSPPQPPNARTLGTENGSDNKDQVGGNIPANWQCELHPDLTSSPRTPQTLFLQVKVRHAREMPGTDDRLHKCWRRWPEQAGLAQGLAITFTSHENDARIPSDGQHRFELSVRSCLMRQTSPPQ
ncbi:hypothetical protein P7K49_007652 [Saguinus oedipus]|uniref:Uncharacterized protein n=1 Tax=Saguinus oedipus TaxID=9490 RepID=A0ABQ9VVI0_SAGOE|nr:hypothetical protein P7K49_007652 [Saguinus oedipus]